MRLQKLEKITVLSICVFHYFTIYCFYTGRWSDIIQRLRVPADGFVYVSTTLRDRLQDVRLKRGRKRRRQGVSERHKHHA